METVTTSRHIEVLGSCLAYHRKDFLKKLRVRRQFGQETFNGCSAYESLKQKAFRPVLGQQRMIESAIRMDLQMRDTLAAWRKELAA